MHESEIEVDLFAGGGGASLGMEWAMGHSPTIAINHDEIAIACHAANHPNTEHFPAKVWKVKPEDVVKGRPVGLLWASPDCKHFSRAKGGKPPVGVLKEVWLRVCQEENAKLADETNAV